MEQVNKDNFTTGVFWKLCEQFGPSLVSLVLSIVLARLLSPEDFGILATAMIFINLCDILVQNGFCTALVQSKEFIKMDYSVAMTLSVILSIVLYIIIFFTSPLVAKFYQIDKLTNLLRVLGTLVLFNGVAAIINAFITKLFKFKLMFITHMISSILSGVAGILMAYFGLGIWALVVQKISQQIIFIAILSILLKWDYRPKYDSATAKRLLDYGMKILGGSVVAFISDNSYSIAIGKKYSSSDLGLLTKAETLPNALILVASNSLAGVVLPTIATYQDDKEKILTSTRRIIKVASYLIFPMVVGMFAVAGPLIRVLFGAAYDGGAPLLRAISLFFITVPTLLICGSVLKAIGKSKLYMWSEIMKMILTLTLVLVCTLVFDIKLIYFILIKGIISVFMVVFTIFFTRKYFGYGYRKHIVDILPAVLLSAAMFLSVWGISFVLTSLPTIVTLIIEVAVGVVVYVGLSYLFKVNSFFDVLAIVKNLLIKVKNSFSHRNKIVEQKEASLVNNENENKEEGENDE